MGLQKMAGPQGEPPKILNAAENTGLDALGVQDGSGMAESRGRKVVKR